MDNVAIIKNKLNQIGCTVSVKENEEITQSFKACIFPLWRKKSSAFESYIGEIGKNEAGYYLFICPADNDITAFSDDAHIVKDDTEYEFKRKSCIESGDKILYYTGILREYKEAQYDEY